MTFRPHVITPASVGTATKTLLYADSGWGKTTQCLHYQREFGKGFVISGESGLRAIKHSGLDYMAFTSWDGTHDPDAGVFSFRGICRDMQTQEFRDKQYTWICLDSLTEVSERLLTHLEVIHKDTKNRHEKWGDFARLMIGSLRWMRDLPYHVLVTALVRSQEDDNGHITYLPMVDGQVAARKIPAIFDCVLAGLKHTETDEHGEKQTVRTVVTDEHDGYAGKVRDADWPGGNVVITDDITTIVHYQQPELS